MGSWSWKHKTLCIVSCGKKKIWSENPEAGPTKAEDAYIGTLSKKGIQYAKKFYPSSWCILSAKYGFLFPEEEVFGDYNTTFKDKRTNPIGVRELSAQVREKGLDKYERIVVLCGKVYSEIVREVFSRKEIYAPLTGCRGNGEMMGKLNDAIRRGVPL